MEIWPVVDQRESTRSIADRAVPTGDRGNEVTFRDGTRCPPHPSPLPGRKGGRSQLSSAKLTLHQTPLRRISGEALATTTLSTPSSLSRSPKWTLNESLPIPASARRKSVRFSTMSQRHLVICPVRTRLLRPQAACRRQIRPDYSAERLGRCRALLTVDVAIAKSSFGADDNLLLFPQGERTYVHRSTHSAAEPPVLVLQLGTLAVPRLPASSAGLGQPAQLPRLCLSNTARGLFGPVRPANAQVRDPSPPRIRQRGGKILVVESLPAALDAPVKISQVTFCPSQLTK